ncbi:MAG: hypothetical protein LUG18_11890 [Candidatus Azobacteroides sp.]|nr:hypothetical protein [Candidatus Azobacteroides sp.]
MRKFYLLFIILLIGKFTFADSTFLPGLEFHYLYQEDPFIFGTQKTGVPEEEYISFLLSDEKPLGEKIALISALASYFEWIAYDDNPDNDDENYFETHTEAFKKRVQEKYNNYPPAEIQLLITLMNDYKTLDPDTGSYDRLADEIGNSLAAQSVKVIAYGYDVLYNRRWNRVEKYEEEYLEPYKESWESYRQDINPQVYKKVTEWLFFIYELRGEVIPEGFRVVPEEESLVSDEPLEIESYEEDGKNIIMARKASGENFSKTVAQWDSINLLDIRIEYKWDSNVETWRQINKTETKYDLQENPVLKIEYRWNKKTEDWLPENKMEVKYKYDKYDYPVSMKVSEYEWKNGDWSEEIRAEVEDTRTKPRSGKMYKKDHTGKFILIDKF